MRFLKNSLKALAAIVILIVIGSYFYLQHIKPKYKGSLSLEGLQTGVEVWFDMYGIPHIYAENKHDLYFALGYVHAQERLWQMELVRRIAPGRLSEILGPDLADTDKFFRTLGIHLTSRQAAAQLRQQPDSPVLQQTEAYLAGINQFISTGPTPFEYTLLGIRKTPFVLEDVYNAVGYMSFSFAAAHKTDPLVDFIKTNLGAIYLDDLGLKADTTKEMIPSYTDGNKNEKAVTSNLLEVLGTLPVPPFIGSNAWVLGPDKTRSGKVLFANDPHIGFSQPAVWYEAYLESPDFQLYGYHLAGFPFAILGHNRHMALGLTMLENDDVDFFRETMVSGDSSRYLYKGDTLVLESREELIEIKGSEPISVIVRSSVHGPLINEVLGDIVGEQPVAMWWVFNQLPNQLLQATYQLNNTVSMEDAAKAASLVHAPGLNVMYGDAEGNIAWWATARLVRRPDSVNSFTILDGASGGDDPTGYYQFSENPHAVNPPWGYVYSANNQPDSTGGFYYPGYYLPEDRAKRIRQLLEERNDWDRVLVKKMLMDQTSLVAAEVTQTLVSLTEASSLTEDEARALADLTAWNGEFTANGIAPTVYTRWLYMLMQQAMGDELGDENFAKLMATDLRKRTFPALVANDNSPWWDDVKTDDRETRRHIINASFRSALSSISEELGPYGARWQWRNVHQMTHNHALGVVPMLGKLLNVGPFSVPSGEEVINNWGYAVSGTNRYDVSFGPSTRRIVDFAAVEQSEGILPTGQSGVFASRHYDDQAAMYVDGAFRPMIINKKELTDSGKLLILHPATQ